MTGVDLQGSGYAPLAPLPPIVLPSIVLVLLIVISPGFGAPPLAEPVRGSSLVQLDPGRRLYLPHAVQEALGEVGMESRAGPALGHGTTSDGSVDLEGKDGSSEWETVLDPRLYVITEYGDAGRVPGSESEFERRRRNGGPSLSIVNPLDVLRQRLLFEIARRRMKQSHSQIIANNEILRNIGKK